MVAQKDRRGSADNGTTMNPLSMDIFYTKEK